MSHKLKRCHKDGECVMWHVNHDEERDGRVPISAIRRFLSQHPDEKNRKQEAFRRDWTYQKPIKNDIVANNEYNGILLSHLDP